MLTKLRREILRKLFAPVRWDVALVGAQLDALTMLSAKAECRNVKERQNVSSLRDVEFKVHSQWGEDGIIEWLLSQVPIENNQFVEFGVEDYTESNTRFLMRNRNWRGLVFDGSSTNVERIRASDLYWKHELTALQAFITRENINSLLRDGGATGDIGLLSIDIDGNDYWVWKAIEVIAPRIVICEFNSIFGATHAITIPYNPEFIRSKAHYSNLFFGASLKALCELAGHKGYIFAGCTSAGNDAFFVRRDCASGLKSISCEEGYVKSRARESKDSEGRWSYVSGDSRIQVIKDCIVHDVAQGRELAIKELFQI